MDGPITNVATFSPMIIRPIAQVKFILWQQLFSKHVLASLAHHAKSRSSVYHCFHKRLELTPLRMFCQ